MFELQLRHNVVGHLGCISYRLGMFELQPDTYLWARLAFEGYRLGMFELQRYTSSQAASSVSLKSLPSTSNNAFLLGG